MFRTKNPFRTRLSDARTSAGSLTVPPLPERPAPLPAKRSHLVPEPPARNHWRPAPAPPPAAPTRQAPSLAFDGAGIRRIIIPMRCAQADRDFIVVFRQNELLHGYFFERVGLPSQTDGPPSGTTTYDLTKLDFSRARCPHCRAQAGPVHCPVGDHYLCRGGVDEAAQYFRCCASCGNHGPLSATLRTIEGSENEAMQQRGPLPGRPRTAQLAAPASPTLLLPGSRR